MPDPKHKAGAGEAFGAVFGEGSSPGGFVPPPRRCAGGRGRRRCPAPGGSKAVPGGTRPPVTQSCGASSPGAESKESGRAGRCRDGAVLPWGWVLPAWGPRLDSLPRCVLGEAGWLAAPPRRSQGSVLGALIAPVRGISAPNPSADGNCSPVSCAAPGRGQDPDSVGRPGGSGCWGLGAGVLGRQCRHAACRGDGFWLWHWRPLSPAAEPCTFV